MLRSSERWQVAQSTTLWPYAIRLANEVLNCTPRNDKSAQSPLELFTGSRVRPNLKHLHHHGTPIYVLKDTLQSAGGYNKKWNSRARLGIYLGPSPKHSQGVSLVLNPRTGLVSPQWHVKHDGLFETMADRPTDTSHGQWKKLAGLVEITAEQTTVRQATVNQVRAARPAPSVTAPWENETNGQDDEYPLHDDDDAISDQADREAAHVEAVPDQMETPVEPAPDSNAPTVNLRRSTRDRTPTREMLQSISQQDLVFAASLEVANDNIYLEDCSTEGMDDPIAFAASKSDPDTMYYHEAMKQPNAEKFRGAMQKEIDDHDKNGHWELVHVAKIPSSTKVLDSVWAMKRKL
jgi:hypothetical protein